jgi:DNA-binding response OmpR family regulator
LVVEDDFLVRTVIDQGLKEAGFEIASAGTASGALSLLDCEGDTYAAIITDIYLEGTPAGWQVAKHARTINGAMAVLYITSASVREFVSQSVPNSALLIKPFEMRKLMDAVRHLLGT